MSKPDPADGSLESILASIRKSLAEQSGEAAAEQPHPSTAPDADAKSTRRHGLTERLAGAAPSAGAAPQPQVSDDLSDLLESSGDALFPAAPASSAPAPQAASPAREDPLWFLSRREEPKPAPGQSPPTSGRNEAATPPPAATAAEPSLTRPEVLRASMPPYFGSSSDSTVVTPPAEASPSAPAAPQARPASSPSPSPAPAAAPPQAPQDPPMAREVSLVAAAAENAAARSASSRAPNLNGAAAASAGAAPGDAASNRALEAVVLDLLKPMLRQWLDENMPRLVAQSLSDEAVRGRGLDGGKKP